MKEHTKYRTHAVVISLLLYVMAVILLPLLIRNPVLRLPIVIIGVLAWLHYCQQFISWIETKMPMLIELKNKLKNKICNLKFRVG